MQTRNTGGFTLLEVVITVAIVGIAASALLYLQKTNWSWHRSATMSMKASQIVEKQIEEARMFIARDTANWSSFYSDYSGKSASEEGVGIAWHCTTSTDPLGNTVDNVWRVTLTASWEAQRPETLVVTTCIARDF